MATSKTRKGTVHNMCSTILWLLWIQKIVQHNRMNFEVSNKPQEAVDNGYWMMGMT